MTQVWSSKRLKSAKIGVRVAKYEGIPVTSNEKAAKKTHPQIFEFEAISIGDDNGQAFLVPLDESSRETAEYIIRAIEAYGGV